MLRVVFFIQIHWRRRSERGCRGRDCGKGKVVLEVLVELVVCHGTGRWDGRFGRRVRAEELMVFWGRDGLDG